MAKGMGGMGAFAKKAQEMQRRMAELQESLKSRIVEGSSGGGAITALVNGHKELVGIKIDPDAVDPDDMEMLEDLILAAVSQGTKKAEEMASEEMSKITGGLSLPGMG